jgi:hypothetical protein
MTASHRYGRHFITYYKNICLYIFILENYSQSIFQLAILVVGHLGCLGYFIDIIMHLYIHFYKDGV